MKDKKTELEIAKRGSVGQLLFRCARLFNEIALSEVRERSGQSGLRTAHTMLFPHIDLEGTRLTELAKRLGISKQAVSQLVLELEEMGVLERRSDPQDGRAKLIQFSGRGMGSLMDGLGVLKEIELGLAEEIGRKEMELLHGILLSLQDVLESRGQGV